MKTERDIFHEQLVVVLENGNDLGLSDMLSHARAADLAESFELIRDEDRSRILFALAPHMAAEVVVMLDEALRGDVVEDLDTNALTEIVAELPPDDAADVLAELPKDEAGEILEHMTDEQSEKIEELLEYDEETAGGIMTPDVVAVFATDTVADAVEQIRQATQEEELHEIYIVDSDRKLVGTVPLRHLVIHAPTTRLEDICDREVVAVGANDDQETVVQVIRKYDVIAAAVINDDGRLLGRITHDDLLDVAEEEAAEDLYRMAGTDAAEFETSSIVRAALVRLTWLLPCMLGTMATASVLLISKAHFDVVLFGALVAFAPMIGAMGGNSGIQISTVIVRGFATGELASTKLLRAMWREGRISLVMAPVCGVSACILVTVGLPLLRGVGFDVGGVADPTRMAVAIGVAMTTGILLAGILGIALPFTFRRLGIDPAIASGPLVTTMNDFVSVSFYMLLAMAIAR